jgi:hypothetical protein
MFEYIEEPEIADFDNLSVFEFKSNKDSPKKLPSPSEPTQNESMDSCPSPPSLKESHIDGKINKKIAKGKKDDFDYKKYIEYELKRLKADNLEGKAKKRLVQKIRNRMSAQRSRQRNKIVLEGLKQENEELKNRNNMLVHNLRSFKEENAVLKERLVAKGNYKRSYSSTDNDEVKSYESEEYVRQEKPNQFNGFRSFLFIAVMVLALAFGTESGNSNVQMAGIVPLLSGQRLRSERSVQRLEQICEAYCHGESDSGKETKRIGGIGHLNADSHGSKRLVLSPTTNGIADAVPLICMEKGNRQNRHEILFKKENLELTKESKHILYVPEILTIVNNFDLIQN